MGVLLFIEICNERHCAKHFILPHWITDTYYNVVYKTRSKMYYGALTFSSPLYSEETEAPREEVT